MFGLTPEVIMLLGNAGLFVLNLIVTNKVEQLKTMVHKDFVSKDELHRWFKAMEKENEGSRHR